MTDNEQGLDLAAKIDELEALAPEVREQPEVAAILDRLRRAAEIWGMPRGPERDAAMQDHLAGAMPLHNRRPAGGQP